MRNVIPPIHEKVATLKERLRHEHNGHKKPRLQMLYLLASRQAPTRQDAALLLGVHRNTISRWLALYAAGGWTSCWPPTSRQANLSRSHRQCSPAWSRPSASPKAFASYEALRQWVHQTQGVEVKDKRLYTIVRTRFRTKLKVPRPSHTKKP